MSQEEEKQLEDEEVGTGLRASLGAVQAPSVPDLPTAAISGTCQETRASSLVQIMERTDTSPSDTHVLVIH